MVTSLYVQHHYQRGKNLYENQDSLFRQALERAKLRLTTGESDGVEVVEATAQLSHLQQLRQEKQNRCCMLCFGIQNPYRNFWYYFAGWDRWCHFIATHWCYVKSEVQHPYLQRLETEMQYNQLEANWTKGLKESQCGLLPLIIHHLGALVPMIAFMVHLQDFPVCNCCLSHFWESVFENRWGYQTHLKKNNGWKYLAEMKNNKPEKYRFNEVVKGCRIRCLFWTAVIAIGGAVAGNSPK